ncbi:MAG: hypothetical protein U0625_11800 [Phycisphaerales bacterium]
MQEATPPSHGRSRARRAAASLAATAAIAAATTSAAQVPPAPATPAPPAAAPTPAPDETPDPVRFEQRVHELLASAWLADAYGLARDPDVPEKGYIAALQTAQRCAELAPQMHSNWEAVLLFAEQVGDGHPALAESARSAALAQLAKLDPKDDVVRLARLTSAIEAHSTAEERVRAYEQILDTKHRAKIGDAVAARLAYQLASLESRIGNSELFARWLGESVKADPSFPTAAQAAAGFFRMRVNDPAADVELLALAVEANPRDRTTMSALLTVLLDGAAFNGAERVARLAIAVAEADKRTEAVYALTGDLATALWGSGRREDAVQELQTRLARLTSEFRLMVSSIDPTITLERLNREYPPVPTSLSIALLALQRTRLDPAAYDDLVRRALQGCDASILRLRKAGAPESELGMVQIEKATLALLFARSIDGVAELLDEAAKTGAMGEAARDRFVGLLQWRRGKPDEAIRTLEPSRAGDPLARYAYASALADADRKRDSAVEFRALAKDLPGTSLGLLALDRLAEVLGQKQLLTSQLSPEIAARAALLDQAVAEQLPRTVDELVENPFRALTVTAEPSARSVGPYEPLRITVTLRNGSRIPLSIGPDAPISGRIVLRAVAPRAADPEPVEIPPQGLSIDRRLRLEPGERLVFDIDVATTDLGRLLSLDPIHAHLVSVSVITNPIPSFLGEIPGFLGSVTTTVPVHCGGIDASDAWVAAARRRIAVAGSVQGLVDLSLLAQLASDPEKLPAGARADAGAIWNEIVAAWKAQPELAQAWVVATLPKETPAMAPLLDAVRASPSAAVITSWLIGRTTDPLDPMLDVARRNGDEKLATLADAAQWVAQRRNKRAIEDVGAAAEGEAPKNAPAIPPAQPGRGRSPR